ncbi:MAG: response regulator, partial [Sedimentisphaerales bacterium]|nr:response regulator [Sedimentisphaerales bacterium]
MSNHTPDTFRVLVIDDEKAILEQFRYVFEPQTETGQNKTELADLQGKLFGLHNNRRSPINIEATFCRQGDEAVEIVRQAVEQHNPFAVAYCDIRMPPGPNGLWTAEHIRRLDNNVHIVMVTAFSDIDPLEFTERVRPPDKLLYVQKPFHPQEIRQFTTALSARWLTEQFSTLQSKNEAIKESDKLKRDFIITVSHELRTPL